ncbi:MAG: sigma-70 family RNA polymerase sigma factor [Eubacteriales bacterium]|nr:sigma-70 family RNA polymerase sigma factor [Eubacteriales bacterium]
MKHYEMLEDEKLIDMYKNGDDRAVDTLFERYKNLVRRKANAMFIVGGDKDDLIQEGMIGLYKAVRSYNGKKDASFATFASLCINSQIMNAVKASNAKKNSPLNSAVSFDQPVNMEDDDNSEVKLVDVLTPLKEQNPEKLYIDQEITDDLKDKVFESLSEFEKEVVNLLMAGNDYMKISAILDKSPKSIDNAIQRARNKVDKLVKR